MRNHGDELKDGYVADDEIQGSTIVVVTADQDDEDDTRRNNTIQSRGKKQQVGSSLVGKNVRTTYGLGIVLEYRVDDGMYVIKLTSETNFAAVAVVYTQQVPTPHKTREDETEELNVAYEALEKMRRLNVQVMCSEAGICRQVDYDMCTTCLLSHGAKGRSHFPRIQRLVDVASSTDLASFPRLHSLFHQSSAVTNKAEIPPHANGGGMNCQNGGEDPSPASHAAENGVDGAAVSSETSMLSDEAGNSVAILSNTRNVPANASPCATTTESPTMADSLMLNVPEQDQETAATEQRTSTHDIEPSPLLAPSTTSDDLPQTAAKRPATFPLIRGLWGSVQSIPNSVASIASTVTSQIDEAIASPNLETNPESTQEDIALVSNPEEGNPDAAAPRDRNATTSVGIRGMFDISSGNASSLLGSATTSITNMSQEIPSIHRRLEKSGPTSTPPSRTAYEKPIALPRIQKLIDKRQKANTFPCLVCGSPCCSSHSSSSFRTEGITLCLSCERLFELDFIVDCVSAPDPAERAYHVDHMITCYDRCMLLLRYSSQFVELLAKSLEEQKEKQDKISLASSSAGVLSGVLGIAAAASILTPVGPPLLIASLFFGGGATSVQTGSEVMNYFSEPRKLADRIIALHGMAVSILRVTSTLRDAMMLDHIRTDVYEAENVLLSSVVQEKLETNRTAVLAGTNIGRTITFGSAAGAEVGVGAAVTAGGAAEVGTVATTAAGAGAARGASAFSRASAATARTVRFARFAGGALSAAVLVLEANAVKSTLRSINEGSPCQKADTLRRVAKEIEDFASTGELDDECQSYLKVLASRPQSTTETIAIPDDSPSQELPEATCMVASASHYVADQQLCTPGFGTVEGDASETIEASPHHQRPRAAGGESNGSVRPFSRTLNASSFFGGSSLLSRFQFREDSAASRTMDEVVAVAVVDDDRLPGAEVNLVI